MGQQLACIALQPQVGADGGGEEVIRLESEPIDKRFTLRIRRIDAGGRNMMLGRCVPVDGKAAK
jgi:hypothetical protein